MANIPGFGTPEPDTTTPNRIRTPHAAVIVWNYDERLGSSESSSINKVDKVIISTVSCVSIQTNKSKSDPQGSFQLTLAPHRNWVGNITPGSWCVLLMSNSPIIESDFNKVDPNKLKMIGKIDTVRVDTRANDDGSRQTMYYVSGVDWGHVFHNILYIDNNLASESDPQNLGSAFAIKLQEILLAGAGQPERVTTASNLRALLGTIGNNLAGGFTAAGENELKLLANAIYNFNIPSELTSYLALKNSSGSPIPAPNNVNSAIKLITGALKTEEDSYTDTSESYGILNPFSLQGAHSFWQVLMDNSNSVVNEMFAEMRPSTTGTQLCLYNRIKPFAIAGPLATAQALAGKGPNGAKNVMSFFQLIKTHLLDPMTVKQINAGTNWKDKYNFVEIKPNFQDDRTMEPMTKPNTQQFDKQAFQREGFRPLIFTTKQLPSPIFEKATFTGSSWDDIAGWVRVLKLWYFDTHKMLNGTIQMTGIDGYIAVGDNIQFDALLINPNKNFNLNQGGLLPSYILAHVENVSHSFTVNSEGARTYTTTIQFVRGILVNKGKTLIDLAANPGILDGKASVTNNDIDLNNQNTLTVGTIEVPKEE